MEDKEPNIYPLLDLFLLAVFIFALSLQTKIDKTEESFRNYYIGDDNCLYVQTNKGIQGIAILEKIAELEKSSIEEIANHVLSNLQTTKCKNGVYILQLSVGKRIERGIKNKLLESLLKIETISNYKICHSITQEVLIEVVDKGDKFSIGDFDMDFAERNAVNNKEIVKGLKMRIAQYRIINGIVIRFDAFKDIEHTIKEFSECNIKYILMN